jgi:hypothetical protein
MKIAIFFLLIVCTTHSVNAQLIDGIWKTFGQKLATTQSESPISENDPLTKRFDKVLNNLDIKYIENKEQIVEMTITNWVDLRLSGIDDPMFNIMEGIYNLVDLKTQKKSYSDNIKVFRILRKKCSNYLCAINGVQNLLTENSMEEIKRKTGLK